MSTVEKHHFQAETERLLEIVIHSLYTDREIFVRELISNAADACEKLRFLQSAGEPILQPEVPLTIALTAEEGAATLTITDTGVGMTRAELVENLGTIAHSGTKAFLKQLAEEKRADAKLIGQFGVGFYSAFMAAAKVEVFTRSARADETSGWHWTSTGAGGYEIEPAADLPRGTRLVLHLKDDAKEFATKFRLEQIIKRYSNFVPVPIDLNGERQNKVQAIWARSKSEITDAEYNEFYHYIGHDPDDPLLRLHFTADAPLAIQALLFVSTRNFESLGFGRTESEVNLHCRKVLIQARAKNLFPEWLRFLKGVVDSEDIPLNISRETMQDTSLIQKLNKVLTGRFLKFLEEQAGKDPAGFEKFYEQYNRFLKEGVVTDFTHKESLGRLLRYESSALEKGKLTSLSEYVKRMKPDQKEIYFLLAPNRESAETSPYFEVFKANGIEVLFSFDPWDELVMDHLHAFEEKPIRPAEKADLQLAAATVENQLTDDQAVALAAWLKETLGQRVHEVRASKRLVGSPAVIIDTDPYSATLRRISRAARPNEAKPEPKLDFEFNPAHPIVTRLEAMRQADAPLATQVAEQMLDNAKVAAGLLEDPREMIGRLNQLLEKLLLKGN
jgi:TNF receptor-associated protein 1